MLITTKGRAELMLRTLTTIYGEATYDEVLMMFRDVESFLEHTPVIDSSLAAVDIVHVVETLYRRRAGRKNNAG